MKASEIVAAYKPPTYEGETDDQQDSRARFNHFFKTFNASRPARRARKQNDLSTIHHVHYLNITKRAFRKEKVHTQQVLHTQPSLPSRRCFCMRTKQFYVASLPPDLRTLVKAQDDSGRWFPSDEVNAILMGNVGVLPEPPGGVSEWRWLTNMVLV